MENLLQQACVFDHCSIEPNKDKNVLHDAKIVVDDA